MPSSNQHHRGPWNTTEDQTLMACVSQHGPLNWVQISERIGTRSAKQCRERFHQNLKPSLNHEPITEEEGRKIERLVEQKGKRWAEIARELNGRSDNAVKNWWNGTQNRQRRKQVRRSGASSHSSSEGHHHQHHQHPYQQPQRHHHHHHHHQQQQYALPPLAAPRDSAPHHAYPPAPAAAWTPSHPHGAPAPAPAPLSLPIRGGHHHHSYETPLPSPVGGPSSPDQPTPSLMSDAGSSYTYSPRPQHPPSPEQMHLPPMHPHQQPLPHPHAHHGWAPSPGGHAAKPADEYHGYARGYAAAGRPAQAPPAPALPRLSALVPAADSSPPAYAPYVPRALAMPRRESLERAAPNAPASPSAGTQLPTAPTTPVAEAAEAPKYPGAKTEPSDARRSAGKMSISDICNKED